MSHNIFNQGLRLFAFGRSVFFSILVIAVSGLLTEIPFDITFETWLDAPAPEILKVTLAHTLTGLILVWLLVRLGMFEDAKFTHPRQWRAVWLVCPFLLFIFLNLDFVISGSLVVDTSRPELIILFIFTNLAIGFAEEVMARGVVLNLLLRKSGEGRRGVYLFVLVSPLYLGSVISLTCSLVTCRLSLT